MRILVLGAGKMGLFFVDLLSFNYETAVYDCDPQKMKFTYNCIRMSSLGEVKDFAPQIVINAVSLKHTIPAFRQVMPYLDAACILCDIASVKTGLKDFYQGCGMRYASSHPMFGPTFANLGNLSDENAIIISEGCHEGIRFFRDLYSHLGLNIHEYSFEKHDQTMAHSLSIPFVSTFVFTAVMQRQDAPGMTFKRHLQIAKGVLSEDDYLLSEILFNPHTNACLSHIREELKILMNIIDSRDECGMIEYLCKIRRNMVETK